MALSRLIPPLPIDADDREVPYAVVPMQPTLPAVLDEKIERAAAYARAARSAATRRAYDSDWAIFTAWCAAHRLDALPATPEVVAVFSDDDPAAGHGLGRATMPETLRYSTVLAM